MAKVKRTVLIPVEITVDSEASYKKYKDDIIRGISSKMGSRVTNGYYNFGTGRITQKSIRQQLNDK